MSCISFRSAAPHSFVASPLDLFALALADSRSPKADLRVALAFGAAARDDTNLWLWIT